MNAIDELSTAAAALPTAIRAAVRTALASTEFNIGAGSWQTELAVCPIAAGAIVAGVWHGGGVADGAAEWGTPDGPSSAVEEFAAWFDICAEDAGLHVAIAAVEAAFRETRLAVTT